MKAIVWFWVACIGMLQLSTAQALTPQQVQDIVVGETDARIESLQKALAQPDAQTAVFLQALADDAVVIAGQQVIMVRDGKGHRPGHRTICTHSCQRTERGEQQPHAR